VAREVAIAVAEVARDSGNGTDLKDQDPAEAVDACMWRPGYPRLIPTESSA
jgi:hypothetical protein